MIAHELKIGKRIWDCHDGRWGVVLLVDGKDEDKWLESDKGDTIVTYRPEDGDGECQTWARDCYPVIKNRYFWGCEVCEEINQDEFDLQHDYDFYCPERGENGFEFELSK